MNPVLLVTKVARFIINYIFRGGIEVNISENNGYRGIMRKRLLSLSNYDILCKAANFKIKGGMNDSNYGRSAHAGGCRTHSPDNAIHSQEIYQSGQARRRHGGRSLACQARSFETFRRKPDQTGNRRQKIKPARWLATIEFTAVRLPLRRSRQLARDNPWYHLLIFSITMPTNKSQWLVTQGMGTR